MTKSAIHIAQFNIARARYPLDDPRMAGFVDNIKRLNGIAERSPGFIWRLEDEDGPDGADFRDDPLMTYTLSVWRDLAALEHFVWNTLHKRFFQQRTDWFEPMGVPNFCIWQIPAGHRPTGPEAQRQLARLQREGPSATCHGWAERASSG
ncbi:MAG: DUF3291 domain-containing protein [Pseudomonadota bacterium]